MSGAFIKKTSTGCFRR